MYSYIFLFFIVYDSAADSNQKKQIVLGKLYFFRCNSPRWILPIVTRKI